ncbi:MAG: tetratricopeptide repeat protein [Candidatus Omnitrophota bacterium]
MTLVFKRSIKAAFLCLIATLLINTRAWGLDKRVSLALSHYIMAGLYEQSGQIPKAIREYKEALRADHQNPRLHFGLACSYIRNKELDKAAEELNLAAGLDPDAVETHTLLALLYSFQNKNEQAISEYEISLSNALKNDPGNIEIYKDLGLLYLQQKKFKEAEKTYKFILQISPEDHQAHFYLANIYEELKNRQEAEKELKASLASKPDYAEALNYLGYLYVEENKNLDAAEAMIKKALEIDPDNGAYVDSLGWLYFRQGKLEDSIKELEKASVLLVDPVIYEHLGEVYLKVGNIEKAKVNWQKLLKLEPGKDKVKERLDSLNK